MNLEQKLTEIYDSLDKLDDIKKIDKLKKQITDKELNLINEYRNNPTIINKKRLYENEIINDYLVCENNINYLIMQINAKFKRRKSCENNKW